jgi:hypothetical protein
MLLSFFPCKEKSSANTRGIAVKIKSALNGQERKQSNNEQCSPFWPCSTCQTPVFAKTFFLSIIILPRVKKIYTRLSTEEVSYRALAIWQPPRSRS